jgi:hypothetical protein
MSSGDAFAIVGLVGIVMSLLIAMYLSRPIKRPKDAQRRRDVTNTYYDPKQFRRKK